MIEKFTTQCYHSYIQFITIHMNNNQFNTFEKLVSEYSEVFAKDKITGDGCYFIKACYKEDVLKQFITTISPHALYKVKNLLKTIKG
ncbi:hypothetical protein [Orbus sasakiae]